MEGGTKWQMASGREVGEENTEGLKGKWGHSFKKTN